MNLIGTKTEITSISRAEYRLSSVHYGGGGGQCAKSLISEYETKSQIEAVC